MVEQSDPALHGVSLKRRSDFSYYAKSSARALRRNPILAYGIAIIVVMVLATLLAPFLFTQDPQALKPTDKFLSPNATYWFGSDHLGRDIYSRTLFGGRVSLTVAASVTVTAMLIGGFLGLVSGYDRRADMVLMRVVDGLMAIPTVLLGMGLMAALLGGSVQNIIIALTVTQSPLAARIVRSSVLELRERTFVEAARAVGATPLRVIWRYILPNTIAPMIVQATFIAAAAVLLESILSFLGAGVDPRTPSWGGMMALAQNYLSRVPWAIIFPGIFLSLTVLGISIAGDGLRDTLDPKLRRLL